MLLTFRIRHSDFVLNNHVLIVLRMASAFSNVSLLPISSHFPLIWYVFTGYACKAIARTGPVDRGYCQLQGMWSGERGPHASNSKGRSRPTFRAASVVSLPGE